MTRVLLENNPMFDPVIEKGFRLRCADLVPADNFPLPADGPPCWFMAPAGAIDILLPTSTVARKGLTFFIYNTSANVITFKTDGDAAFTVPIVAAANQMTILTCTGSTTQASGWRGHSAAGTQTSP